MTGTGTVTVKETEAQRGEWPQPTQWVREEPEQNPGLQSWGELDDSLHTWGTIGSPVPEAPSPSGSHGKGVEGEGSEDRARDVV